MSIQPSAPADGFCFTCSCRDGRIRPSKPSAARQVFSRQRIFLRRPSEMHHPLSNTAADQPEDSMSKINIAEKFANITEYYKPRIAAELNGQQVKFVKLNSKFVFHH